MFPAMIIIVLTMLGLMRIGHRFERWKAIILLVMCVTYLGVLLTVNPGALASEIH
jgi:Mn2+/Fe2+ NRAMP family transporter